MYTSVHWKLPKMMKEIQKSEINGKIHIFRDLENSIFWGI